MRTQKASPQMIKRIFRPELTHCLECQTRLRSSATISQRTVITLKQVIRVIHCAYRCPHPSCPGRQRLYRSAAADALALPGFPFGLDLVRLVGRLRLAEHQTVHEIHQSLLGHLAPLRALHLPSRDPLSL